MTELVFLFSADADIQTDYNFYESFQSGRGEIFMTVLDVTLGHLRQSPTIAPVFQGSYRRLLMRGFPYGIFYSIEGGRIIVAAVVDLRQDPELFVNDCLVETRRFTPTRRALSYER